MSAYSETVNVIMRSRMRESRTYGSVRGRHREVLVYSTDDQGNVAKRNQKLSKRKRKKMLQNKHSLCLNNKGEIISENIKKKYLCCRNSMHSLSAIFYLYSFFIGK